ncbi:DUF6894 family protein [Pararhizobium arenae]|uniref:DUF6894 family protein n=1 Tax=Pararhizobium arenae TaxID=1856850 RepID=UPI00094AD95C|nr:hypothetical protein [Pararhizobium arenae]
MPKYFFHVRDYEEFFEDLEGADFADDRAAIQEATAAAREICAEKLKFGEEIDGHVSEVTAEDGVVIETIPFNSVIDI